MNNLKNYQKLSYGVGAFGKDLVYSLVATYIMYYFNDVLGINALFLGSLFLGARIFDAINDPMMGMIVDNTKSRFGKFRPWIFIGTIINAFVLVALFTKPQLEGNTFLIYISIFYILWGISYTIMDIPYWAMIPALTQDQKEREQIAAIPRVFASIGFSTVVVGGLPLVQLLGKGDDQQGFFVLALIIAIIFILTITVTVVNVKEQDFAIKRERITVRKMLKTLVKNDQLLIVIITIILFNVSTYITSTLGMYFFKYDIGNALLFSIFGAIGGVGQIISMAIFPLLTSKFSRKQIFIFGVGLTITGYLVLLLSSSLNIASLVILYGAGFMIFFGFGFATILTTVMLADTVEYGEWKFNQRSESIIFSMQTFVVKFSSAISGFIAGAGLTIIKFIPDQPQTPQTLAGLRVIMFVIPIIGLIISLLVYLKYYKLNEETYNNIVTEIRKRQESKAV